LAPVRWNPTSQNKVFVAVALRPFRSPIFMGFPLPFGGRCGAVYKIFGRLKGGVTPAALKSGMASAFGMNLTDAETQALFDRFDSNREWYHLCVL
jgi:hypothetical protein